MVFGGFCQSGGSANVWPLKRQVDIGMEGETTRP